jgi:hypothetical protein
MVLRGRAEELRHVEPCGEVVADGTEHAHPQIVVAVEQRQGVGELRHHLRVERIALGRIVDRDLQDVPVPLMADLSRRRLFGHFALLCCGAHGSSSP